MLCNFRYILHKNFSFGPYPCNGCYNIMQKSNDFKNIAIAEKAHIGFIFRISVSVEQNN